VLLWWWLLTSDAMGGVLIAAKRACVRVCVCVYLNSKSKLRRGGVVFSLRCKKL